jgi:hypothetical protein
MSELTFRSEYYQKLLPFIGCKHAPDSLTGARQFLHFLHEEKSKPEKPEALLAAYEWLETRWKDSNHGKAGGRRNLHTGVSKENWLLKRKHRQRGAKPLSPELHVEFTAAQAIESCDFTSKAEPFAKECGNAVAATSGLLGQWHGDRRGFMQVDLIRLLSEEGDAAELIELKYRNPKSSGSGLGMLVGASLQAALYALSLVLWHANASDLCDGQREQFVADRPLLKRTDWKIKTLVNVACLKATKGDPKLMGKLCDNLRLLSNWIERELSAVVKYRPTAITVRPLSFQHSFHEFDDNWNTRSDLTSTEMCDVLKIRWDDPTA